MQEEASTSYDSEPGWPMLRLAGEPENVRIKTASFVKSSVEHSQCPPQKLPEFAVIGRSNVGKSSLINMLTSSRLALVSKEPGKTRCINHFLINNAWYMVDLPGFGYARTGKDTREQFDNFTRDYFVQRATLAHVLLLVDASIPPQRIDLEYASWLASRAIPFSVVFTKADKKRKGRGSKADNMEGFQRALLQDYGFRYLPPCLVTSSSKGAGKGEVLAHIALLRSMFERAGGRRF